MPAVGDVIEPMQQHARGDSFILDDFVWSSGVRVIGSIIFENDVSCHSDVVKEDFY